MSTASEPFRNRARRLLRTARRTVGRRPVVVVAIGVAIATLVVASVVAQSQRGTSPTASARSGRTDRRTDSDAAPRTTVGATVPSTASGPSATPSSGAGTTARTGAAATESTVPAPETTRATAVAVADAPPRPPSSGEGTTTSRSSSIAPTLEPDTSAPTVAPSASTVPSTPASTTTLPPEPADASLLAFLRRNSLLRSNDEGFSFCESSSGFASRATSPIWLIEKQPAAGSDLFLVCVYLPAAFDRIDIELRTPAGRVVSTLSAEPDPTQTILTTHAVPPGFGLLATVKGQRARHYVGMTEPTQDPNDAGWVAEFTLLVGVDRPEGDWSISADSGTTALSGVLPIPNHCSAAPATSYWGSDPFVVPTGTRIAAGGEVLDPSTNCRVIPDLVGADFAKTESALRAHAGYGEFTVTTLPGNCGLRSASGGPGRDNQPGFVDVVSPSAGQYYMPGQTVQLLHTIKCPKFPESLLSVHYTSAGFAFWQAAPSPFADVKKALDALAVAFADWRWTADSRCLASSIVTRFETNEVNAPPSGPTFWSPEPGLLVPVVEVLC